jgi:hypothetical protein
MEYSEGWFRNEKEGLFTNIDHLIICRVLQTMVQIQVFLITLKWILFLV